MKKHGKLLLFILLAACLYVSGCSMREHIDPMEPAPTAISATPAPGQPQEAIPEESPTPEPTPISASEVIREGGAELNRLSSYDQAAERLGGNPEVGFTDLYPGADFAAPADSIRLAAAQADGDLLAMGDGVIYVLADKDLVVLLPDVEAESPLARIRVGLNWTGEAGGLAGQEKSPRGIYVQGDRLVVVSDWYGYENGAGVQYSEYTAADIYDISDPAAPVQMISFGQGGSFSQAGIWEDRFYLITEAPVFESDEEKTAEELIPKIYTNGGSLLLPADRITVAPDGNGSGFTLLGI